MAASNSTTELSSSKLECTLFWECSYCLYENPATFMSCKFCKRQPSNDAKFFTVPELSEENSTQFNSEFVSEELEETTEMHLTNDFSFESGKLSLPYCVPCQRISPHDKSKVEHFAAILQKRHKSLNKSKAKFASELVLRNYEEWLAVESAKTNDTFEMALMACKRHVNRKNRVVELLAGNILSTESQAGLAVTLMDFGHPRNISIKAAKCYNNVEEAQTFINNNFLVGNRCFSKLDLDDILKTLKSEEREIPIFKLEIAGKLMLIGHSKKNALNAAKMYDTLEQAKNLCMEQRGFQQRVDDMVNEEILPNKTKASLAVQLIDLKYSKKYAILAACKCSSLQEAKEYLQTECKICLNIVPRCEMITMLYCHHYFCHHCLKTHFTVSIRERNHITNISCPACNEPNLDDTDTASKYFIYLHELLKTIIDPSVSEIFQKKLKEFILISNPEHLWCPACHGPSVFKVDPQGRRLLCPTCKCQICAQCKKQWDDNHEGKSCKEFATWHRRETSKQSKDDLKTYLNTISISCPRCKFQYEFVRGGCMHLSCLTCRHQFCVCCKKPFNYGAECKTSEACKKMGLHAHHPRYCLYFWRDRNVKHLKLLLDMHNIIYDVKDIKTEEDKEYQGCRIKEESDSGGRDTVGYCGKVVKHGQAGLCKAHYNEYLVHLIVKHGLDPALIMNLNELTSECGRHQKALPKKLDDETNDDYLYRLSTFVMNHIPLFD